MFRGVIDFRRYWWIFRSESRDALSHRQYKGAQVATISRLRKREGRQQVAVPVLVLLEPALVLPAATDTELQALQIGALFFHPPTHLR